AFDLSTKIWNIGVLPIGGTQTLNITARAQAGTSSQTISNTITYALDQADNSPGDVLSVDVLVNSDLDLVIGKTVDNAQPNEGETIVFSITAENLGPARATNVSMDDILPAQFTFVSATTSAGSTFTDPNWAITQIEAGETAQVDISATVNAGTAGQVVTNTVTSVTLDQTDLNTTADDYSEQVSIRNESDIYVTKTVDKGIIHGGTGTAKFTIRVENKGPLVVNGLEIDDDLDDKLIFVGATASKGSFTEPVWTVGTLAVGEVATLEIDVLPTEDSQNTTIVNTVSRIFSDRDDSNITPDDLTAELNILGDSSVILKIKANKDVVAVADLLGFELEVESLVTEAFDPLEVSVNLPQGLTYVEGTTRVVRAGVDGELDTEDDTYLEVGSEEIRSLGAGDSIVVSGKLLEFLLGTGGLEKYKVVFTTRVGSSAIGNVLSVGAFAEFEDIQVTADVKAVVLMKKNEIFDITSIIGKTFHDRDGDGYQDESIVRNLRVFGGTTLGNLKDSGALIDRGDGFKPIKGNVKRGYKLGVLKGRSSRNDLGANTQVKLKIPMHTEKYVDLELTTSEGTAITLKEDGRVFEKHTGLRRKGMSAQDLLVSRVFIEENEEKFLLVTINNVGIDEEGVPGVRVYGVNGLAHETDEFGRFHIPDIELEHNRGQNYILKVDTATLPKNAILTTENPRVIRLTGGLHTKFNFGVKIPMASEGKFFQSKKVSKGIYFDSADSGIRESEVSKIDSLNRELSGLPLDLSEGKVSIQGFSDFKGSAAKNRVLSLERAKTVMTKIKDVAADLDFDISVDNTTPHEQEVVKFVAKIRNKGLSDVSNLEVILPLPAQFDMYGRIKSNLGNYNAQRWFIKDLGGKSSARLEFTAKTKALTSDEEFVLPVMNYIYEGLERKRKLHGVASLGKIKNELDFNVVTSANRTEVDEREVFEYTVTGVNNGPAAATKLAMDLIKDKNLTVHSVEVSHGAVSGGKWSIGTLMPGERVMAKVRANAKVGSATKQVVVGVSTIYAEQIDTNKSKDIETLALQVKNNLDMFIASKFDVEKTNEGDRIKFRVKADNKGPIKATNVEVSVSFDDDLELLSSKATKGKFADNVWTISSIDYEESEEIEFTLSAKPRSGSATLRGMVYDVSQDQIDLDMTKDVLEDSVEVLNNTDLVLHKTVSDRSPEEGDEVRLVWTITNKGPAVAQNIALEDTIDKALLKAGKIRVTKGKASGSKWKISELIVGESAEMSVMVKIAAGTGGSKVTDPVEVFTHEQEDLVKNSKDSINLRVSDETNIIVLKEFDKDRADEGDEVLSTLRVKNMGPAMANDVVIKDVVHAGLINHRDMKMSKNSSQVTGSWLIPALKVGETAELTWKSTVAPGMGGTVITDKIDKIEMIEDFKVISKESLKDSIIINNETDLLTRISASTKTIDLGEDFELNYFVRNQGPALVENLKIDPPLDECLSLVSAKSNKGKVNKKSVQVASLEDKEEFSMTLVVRPNYDCSKDEIISAFGVIEMEQTEVSDKGDVITVPVKINKEVESLVKVLNPEVKVHEGEELVFEIRQENLGAAFVNKSVVVFEISDNLEVSKMTTTKGELIGLEWTLNNFKYSDKESLKIYAKVKMRTSQTKAYVRLKSHKIDKNDLNNVADVYKKEYTVENQSDINVEIKALEQKVNVPYVTYKYTVRNNGPAVATNVKLTPVYDKKSLKVISQDLSEGTVYSKNGVWSVEEIYPGQSIEMIWTFELDNFTSPVELAAYEGFSMNQEDSGFTEDVQKSAIVVQNVAKIKMKKSVSRKDIYETEGFNYTIELKNVGSQIARSIEIKDQADQELLQVTGGAEASRGQYSNGIWTIKSLRAGETARLTVPVKFIGSLKEDIKFSDPIDSFTMEQESYYDLNKLRRFEYGVKSIVRTISGEADEK
ncbi:MAG: hypothetical protein ACRBBP_00090, partial [Bdellovibrionales bacterium]